MITIFLFFRRRLPQLPSHLPLWLCHKWVWLELQYHHCLYWSHVFLGFGQGPQEGVEGNYQRSRPANRWWQYQKWLSHSNYRLCNWYWGVNTKTERSNMYRIFLVLGWWLPCFWLLPEINIGFKETVWTSFSRFKVLLLTINISQELGSASTVFSAKNQRDTRRMKDDWIWFNSIRTTKHICGSDLLK